MRVFSKVLLLTSVAALIPVATPAFAQTSDELAQMEQDVDRGIEDVIYTRPEHPVSEPYFEYLDEERNQQRNPPEEIPAGSWLDEPGGFWKSALQWFVAVDGDRLIKLTWLGAGSAICVLNPAPCALVLLSGMSLLELRDKLDSMYPGLLPLGVTNLPTSFAGVANPGDEEAVNYSGTRSKNIVSGGYGGPDGQGSFRGLLSRNLSVSGTYKEETESGTFKGRVTKDLSQAFGGATCQRGCDDD